jgi:hypothetical protein
VNWVFNGSGTIAFDKTAQAGEQYVWTAAGAKVTEPKQWMVNLPRMVENRDLPVFNAALSVNSSKFPWDSPPAPPKP